MEEPPPDALLQEITQKLETKPTSPSAEWYGDLTRLLAFAPLKLKSERPLASPDGHSYLVFQLPNPSEIPDVDYSQYTLNETCQTLLELGAGAIIEYPKGGTLWSFSLGSIHNLQIEKDPYRNRDERTWGWPQKPPERNEIQLYPGHHAVLPDEILNPIRRFLRTVKPPIDNWGVAYYPPDEAVSMFIQPALTRRQADPEPILKHLRWFTPHHFYWVALDPPKS